MTDTTIQKPSPGILSFPVAASSGLAFVLAFPTFDQAWLAPVALLPLLWVAARERSAWRRFWSGQVAGSVFFAGSCYWVYPVQREFGGLGIAEAAFIYFLFFSVLGIYWGLFCWLAGRLWQLRWRIWWGPAAIPLLWVGIEYARTYLLTGFPWLLSGYLLTNYFSLARLARWTGVYGLSYLVAMVPVAILWVIMRPGFQPVLRHGLQTGRAALAHLAIVSITLLVLAYYPAGSPQWREDQGALLVQTQIPQQVAFQRWDSESQAALLGRLEELTVGGMSGEEHPVLVVWPEMPAPFYYYDDGFTRPFLERIARRTQSHFLTGIVNYSPGSDHQEPLNSALLLSPTGDVVSRYDKIHLVPFGEYVPLRRWARFAERLTAEVSDFSAGSELVVSPLPGGRMAAFVCYEAIFPNQVRQFVKGGAQVLVNISNDGWFGSSSARYQNLLMARMRAIENARYLLRTTNTGITALIRPDGTLADRLPPDQPGVLKARWSFEDQKTFYSEHGDWFAITATALAAWALFWTLGMLRPPGAL